MGRGCRCLRRIAYLPGSPVPDSTSSPVAVVADTIVRTVELGVTITNAAVDGDITVVLCDLLTEGPQSCPGCGGEAVYRDTVIRRVTDVPVVGHPPSAAGPSTALPLHHQRLLAVRLQSQHFPPGPAGMVDHAAVRAPHHDPGQHCHIWLTIVRQ